MKALIIGASGFIGNACLEYFSSKNDVIGIDKIGSQNKKIKVDKDLSITRSLIENSNFDIIINCSGASDIQGSFVNKENDRALNVSLVENISTLIIERSPNSRFINLSSAAVYGNPSKLPVKETDPTAPLSPYGEHKLQAENFIEHATQKNGLKALSLRIFSAYGVGLKRQLFYDLSQKFIKHPNKVVLHGTGRESRDFIYITDIISAMNSLIQNATFNGEVYNVANGEEIFIDELATAYANYFGYKGEIEYTQEQFAGYPLNWKADITKLKGKGYEPKVSLNEGMQLYCDWIKHN